MDAVIDDSAANCSRADDRGLFGSPVLLQGVADGSGKRVAAAERAPAAHSAQGRWIGLLSVSRAGLGKLKSVLAALRRRPDFDSLDMPVLLNALVDENAAIEVLYVHGHWRGVNDVGDFGRAVDFAHGQTPFGGSAGAPGADGAG